MSGGDMELAASDGEVDDYFSEHQQNNNFSYGDPYDPYVTSPIKPILIATYIPLFLMGMMGNLLVIFVIARNRSMQTVTNFFLANLAVADLLVAMCCVIPKLLWFILESWTLGSFVCRMHHTMISLTTNASIFILTVISAERFIAIVYPFETKQILTSQRLFVAVVGVWCLSAVLSCPTAFFHETVVYGDKLYCASSAVSSFTVRIHTTVMFFICFIIPLIIMSILYLKISSRLWNRNREGKLGMVSRNNYSYTRRSSVDAVLEKAEIGAVFRNTDSPVRCDVNRSSKNPSMEEVTSFIPKLNDETSDYASDHNVSSIETSASPNADDYCVKIGPFFLDDPEEIYDPVQSIVVDDPDHKWNLCKDPPMGITKIDLKHVKFGFDGENVKRVHRLQSQQSEDSIDSVTAKPNGKCVQGNADIITECDKLTNTGKYVLQSPRIKLTQAQSSFDSHYRADRDSPILSVSGSTTSASIGSKIARRKKQRNAKAVMIARRKVIRLLIIMIVAFALCLFPIQLIGFWSHYGEFIPQQTMAGTLFIPFAYAAYFFNSALNPFLYAFLSDNFRTKMKETLCIPRKKNRDIQKRHKKIRNVPSEVYTESDWTHSLHLTTDASLHQI
ncbi:uncharacterized protein [Amphiura filiformis]|uniref:uncharacterized protein n=1 Tax=Amphiura filiformis TaxID=82378 RepID=UPI003B2281C4